MIPSHGDFTVGWVTAIRKEYTAARQVLDEEYETTNFVLPRADRNTYTYGRIGKHYVLITCLQNAQQGIQSTADAADDMKSSFPMVRVLLIVGIANGLPTANNDVRLGDVVVGTEIIRYKVGDATGGAFEYTSHVEPAGRALFGGTQGLAVQLDEGLDLHQLLEETFVKTQKIKDDYQQPRNHRDQLLKADYGHASSCECLSSNPLDENTIIVRPDRPAYDRIKVHNGKIGSTDEVLNDSTIRDKVAKDLDILCSKQGPASSINSFPCLHVRGICDYSDSHKYEVWNGYAAAAASVYTKKLLQTMAAEEVWRMGISIDTKNLKQFIEYLIYEVNQATNISARLAEQETKFMVTARALRGVKTGVELLVQLAQETMSGGQRHSSDVQGLRERWDGIAASQAELKTALITLGAHIKYLQKSGSSKDARSECDKLNIRVQTSTTALQDLSTLIKPVLMSLMQSREQEDMTLSDVASISPSEGTRKTSKLGELSTKAFTKAERHVSRQSISEIPGSKEGDDLQLSPDLQSQNLPFKFSSVFRKEDKYKPYNGSTIESSASENEKSKSIGMSWRSSIQAMKSNKSRLDISFAQEKTSSGAKKPSQDAPPKSNTPRPDSPQELPGRTSVEESSTPTQGRSPTPLPTRPPLVSPSSSAHFNFPSLENLGKLGSDGDISELDFDPRKEVLKNFDDRAGSRASSPKPTLRDRS
ncbi:hypothetical protein N7456_008827 [Penicillium angulare]|uniref:Nucleoside phosphorylase domain-containing protein n=1 Tax=Penicillium angulare TaxID=116970 RepID=A0A9W9F3T1_9EURO|nr:hypothetical protein N7456_008827 [Penicillium angulare]